MIKLKLAKGRSYSNATIKATKKNPYVTVETDEEAAALVATKHFVIVAEATEQESESDEEDDGAAVDFAAMSAMTKAKLTEYAAENGIDISTAKTKEQILALISEYYGGSSTMIDIEEA